MKKLLASGLILIFSFIASGKEIILENNFLRAKIVPRGGKVKELYDKVGKRELLSSDNSILNGAGKSREILFKNIETLTAKFDLKKVSPQSVQAAYTIGTGSIAGMEIVRTYSLDPGSAFLKIREVWKSKTRPNQLLLNWHNSCRWLPGKNVLYIPSKSGIIEVDRSVAETNRINLSHNLSEPWIAVFNGKNGTALHFDNIKQLASIFSWAVKSKLTLEANFNEVNLKPVAENDELKTSGEIIPFCGIGRIVSISRKAILSATRDTAAIYFPQNLGAGELTVNGIPQKINAETGTTVKFKIKDKANKIKLSTSKCEISFSIPDKFFEKNTLKPLTKMGLRKIPGINGFYYYYPDLFLSDEIGTELTLGLRGNFSKTKNFRLAVMLPAGVKITQSRFPVSKKSQVTINGQKLNRYEIKSRYKTSTCATWIMVWRSDDSFKAGSKAYIQAVWHNGVQPMQVINLKKIKKFPEIGNGLKYFRIALSARTDIGMKWPPEYRKFGVNHVEIWDYNLPMFHDAYKGKGFYAKRLQAVKDAGLTCSMQLTYPFSRCRNVANGKMLEGAGRIFHPEFSEEKINLKDILARDINGKEVKMICPSYRGRYFKKTLDIVKTAVDYGFDELSYEEESWNRGNTICFCQRCKKAFGKDDISPDSDEWWDYKTDQVADIYRQIRETLGDDKRITVWTNSLVKENGRYGAITQRLTDYRKIGKYVDQLWPMYYTIDSGSVGELAKTIANMLKDRRAKVVMGLCPNRYYEYYRVHSGNFAKMDAVHQQILESCFEGAVGVVFWGHLGGLRGAHDYYQIAQAVKMLQPVEEIIARGTRVELENSNPEVKVTAYKYKDRYAVFLRNYDRETVKTNLKLPGKAVDTLTGSSVGNNITLADKRTKVLLVK